MDLQRIYNYVNKQLASKKEETLQIQIEDLKKNISDIQYMYENQIKELVYKLEMTKLEMNKLEMNKLEMNNKNNYDNYDDKNNSTTIEELEEEIIRPPFAGFRNGPNNYEMSDFGNKKQPEIN